MPNNPTKLSDAEERWEGEGGHPRTAGDPGTMAFVSDIEAIRARARERIAEGAHTDAYRADRFAVVAVLNEALATEVVCTLRYRHHYFMANGINSRPIADEFLKHSNEEQEHADWIAERITQLGGTPDLDPATISGRAHAEYVAGNNLLEMIREDIVAERIAIETYTEMTRWLGDRDPTTRRLIERILEMEEEHADELVRLLHSISIDKPLASSRIH